MDGLSIASGAIAILQVASSILNICYHTRAILKHKPWSLSRVQDETRELRGVLESVLQLTIDSCIDGKENFSLEILAQTQCGRGPLLVCLEDLRALEETLLRKYSSEPRTRVHALARAMVWDLSESEIEPILDRLARSKAALSLALSADEMALLIELKKWSVDMTDEVIHVNQSLQSLSVDIASRNNDEAAEKIFKWLSPIDPWDSYASAIQRCHEGTGGWFLHSPSFKDWKNGDGDNIWLSGFAGCGKTVLVSHVIKHLMLWTQEDDSRPTLAYFYCDFRNPDTQDFAGFLGTIICQALLKNSSVPDDIGSYFRLCTAGGNYRKPELPFLLSTLKTLATNAKLLVVIDALDEVEDKAEFLHFFRTECQAMENTSFIIASRESEEIRDSLQAFHHIQIEEQVALVDEDIAKFIEYRLGVDQTLQWLSDKVKAEVLDSLRSRSSFAGFNAKWKLYADFAQ
ncbi:hypothetical protein F5Y16DRAFT_401037 [Xylariaceae sp. FL0255]|nr:hypothetical protein F5Y16DRAFT_401037 [Xylariaceae sp. FL0255]